MNYLAVAILFALSHGVAGYSTGQEVSHRFLACGASTYIMGEDGTVEWSYPKKTRDGYVLDNGDVLLALNRTKEYPGGAVVILKPDGTEILIWKGTQSEVNSAQPTPEGTIVVTEAGAKPRLLELDRDGMVVVEFSLECQTDDLHKQSRMARKLADGSFLVPHLLDFAVKQYTADGTVKAVIDTTVSGDPDRKIRTWPFTAIRHGDGRTLVACTQGNRVVDFDSDGNVEWQLTNDDLPGPWLQDPCGCQLLPNGNIVVTSYGAGRKDLAAPKMFEVTREKAVVWKYSDEKKVGIHHFQILSANGQPLSDKSMK